MSLSLSVIIPLGPGERAGEAIASELRRSASCALAGWREVEIVWVAAQGGGHEASELERFCATAREGGLSARWMEAPRGRARQLNAGAASSDADALFFLHADSRFDPEIFSALGASIGSRPRAIHYFGLRFYDGPAAMRINTFGVWIRSRLMGIPFGDQGFAMRREVFESLRGFDERLEREEDHDFIWRARRGGIRLAAVGADLRTSARRYREQGWVRVTALYGYLTYRRAIPELARFLARRGRGAR